VSTKLYALIHFVVNDLVWERSWLCPQGVIDFYFSKFFCELNFWPCLVKIKVSEKAFPNVRWGNIWGGHSHFAVAGFREPTWLDLTLGAPPGNTLNLNLYGRTKCVYVGRVTLGLFSGWFYFDRMYQIFGVNSIQFNFISPQTSQYMVNIMRKNYIDGEKGHLEI
jgi:hypothetical protein